MRTIYVSGSHNSSLWGEAFRENEHKGISHKGRLGWNNHSASAKMIIFLSPPHNHTHTGHFGIKRASALNVLQDRSSASTRKHSLMTQRLFFLTGGHHSHAGRLRWATRSDHGYSGDAFSHSEDVKDPRGGHPGFLTGLSSTRGNHLYER